MNQNPNKSHFNTQTYPAHVMCTTFPRFPDLAAELRCKIWEHALESHAEHVIATAPPQIRHPTDWKGEPVPFDDGVSVLVVDCIAISAACREARDFHQRHIRQLRRRERAFKYVSEWWYDPSGAGPRAIMLRGKGGGDDGDSTVVTISGGRFRSAKHLVAVVTMLFGNSVERIDLVFEIRGEVSARECVSRWVYWPVASFWAFDRGDSDPIDDHGRILDTVFNAVWKKVEDSLITSCEPEHDFPENDPEVASLVPDAIDHLIVLYPDLSMRFSWPLAGVDHFKAVHLLRMRDLFYAAAESLPRLSRLDFSSEHYDLWALDPTGRIRDGVEIFDTEWLRLSCVRKGELFCCWMHEWPSWTFLWR